MLLDAISSPADLRDLGPRELEELCREIREFMVAKIAKTGGHLGPNLGAVELTIALHRVFDSPDDAIIWDVGHQAYVHKIVTGRKDQFDELRQLGGLSGYPSREESRHDLIENSHASTSLSYAAGLAQSLKLSHIDRRVVAVIGDGALTGGMAYEALNQIAHRELDVTIVLNDNGRSYDPTVGGLQAHLSRLRIDPLYQRAKQDVNDVLHRLAGPGDLLASGLGRLKGSIKELVAEPTIFDSLGLVYSGPIDGHDIGQVEHALRNASKIEGPVVVHLITEKGRGYEPAETDQADHLHGVGQFDPNTGRAPAAINAKQPGKKSWTSIFEQAMLDEARENPDVVGITAAMQRSVGLEPFAEEFPDRCFDVGIAEQHATTFAGGLAMGGKRPVVAIYATFMNRAVDQLLMDVGLHRLPVTFVLDRAGVTGADGPSHHGIFDFAFFRPLPGFVIAAPSNPDELRDLLHTALCHDGPFVIRFAKGSATDLDPRPPRQIPIGQWEIEEAPGGVALLAVGNMVEVAQKAALGLDEKGIPAAVVNARFVKPLDERLAGLAQRHRVIATIEDHEIQCGFGAGVLEALADAGIATPVERFAVPEQFLPHGSASKLHERSGLTPDAIVSRLERRFNSSS